MDLPAPQSNYTHMPTKRAADENAVAIAISQKQTFPNALSNFRMLLS